MTVLCPRCNEVLYIPHDKDYVVCPLCGNTIYKANETHDSKDEEPISGSE